jgi:hypothetical protein
MIGGTERLLEARRAVPTDRQKSIGEAEALFLTNASQSLAKGNRDRGCHALASQLCQFLCHLVGLAILDIQSHSLPFYREICTTVLLDFMRTQEEARGKAPMPRSRRLLGRIAGWTVRRLL